MPTPTPEQRAKAEELARDAHAVDLAADTSPVDAIAWALADAHATGWSEADDWAGTPAADRPRARELDHNTTAHRLAHLVAGMAADDRDGLEEHIRAALADAYASGRHDQLADQTSAGLVLTREQLTELRQTFASMPYGGSLRGHGFGQRPADGVELVGALQDLRAVLRIIAEEDQARTAELTELRRQREAFREYAGAGLLGLLALAKADAPNPLELAHRAESLPVGSTGPHLASLIEEEAHRLGYTSVSEFLLAPGRIDLLERHARERAGLIARQADERAAADIRPEEEAAYLDADQRVADAARD